MEGLATKIAENTKIVANFAEREGLKVGFDPDSAAAFPSTAPSEVLEARRIVKEATQSLHDLVTGPAEHLRWLAARVSAKDSILLKSMPTADHGRSIMICPVFGIFTTSNSLSRSHLTALCRTKR